MDVDKLELEKQLVKMRGELFLKDLNFTFIVLIYYMFYPVIMTMITMNEHIGVAIHDTMMRFDNEIEELAEDFNIMVQEYDAM